MSTATGAERPMTVRRMRFPYPDSLQAWWNPKRPEFSQLVNGSSLAMPYLEPYVIETMRQAREKIADPRLLADIDLYIGQESTHFRQHQLFNKRLAGFGYQAVAAHEALLKEDFERYRRERSFAFHLAYAEGFEAVALAISHMLVEEREFLFADADPAVASLILWHFVEEMEHKCVTYDVFKALDGRYSRRIYGLLFATMHVIIRVRGGYRKLLLEDGRWYNWKSRLALYGVLLRIFARVTPRFLRILRPNYDPREVEDSAWVKAWWRMHEEGRENLGHLDTTKLSAPEPVMRGATA
jgi:predicted metal-dependent hydrolase